MESINKSEVQKEAEIDKLNDDCLNYIFDFLQVKDKVKIERVCKRWQAASKDSWQNIKTLNADANVWGFHPRAKSSHQLTLIFDQVLQRCGRILTHVNFSFLNIRNNVLDYVAKTCPNLQSLNTGQLKLTLPVLKALTAHCHDIREITFTVCSKACNDYHLSKLFSKNKKLRYLKITSNENLTGKFLESLPEDSMEVIILNDCMKMSAHHVTQVMPSFENLQTLSFMENCWTFNVPNTIVYSLPNKIIELRLSVALKLHTNTISSLTNLQILDISNSDISDTFLTVLAKNSKELLNLNLSGCNQVTDAGIQAISNLPKLEELYVRNLGNITDQPLKYLPKLKRLSCALCLKIRDEGLCTLISLCDSIELLDCSRCKNITNKLVDCAIKATKLRSNGIVLKLFVRGTSVDRESVSEESPLLDLSFIPLAFSEDTSDTTDDDYTYGSDSFDEDIDHGYGFNVYEYDYYDEDYIE